jgi:tetratricopeptide (TPR) repeat protein
MLSRLTFACVALAFACATPRRPAVVSLTSAEYAESSSAQTALHEGAYDQAISRADRAVQLGPNDPFAHLTRAAALAGTGDTAEALLAYAHAEALYARDPHGRSLAVYGRARVLESAGRCGEARAEYERYARLVEASDPASATMARSYGAACKTPTAPAPELTAIDEALMRGDAVTALALASEALRGTWKSAERAYFDEARGMALVGLGRTKEALAAFERAAQEVQDASGSEVIGARALWNEGRAFREAAMCDQARKAWERYAAAVPAEAEMAERYARECPGTVWPSLK